MSRKAIDDISEHRRRERINEVLYHPNHQMRRNENIDVDYPDENNR